jgi:hypothetical protein
MTKIQDGTSKIILHFKGEWDGAPLVVKIELPNGQSSSDRDLSDLQEAIFNGQILKDWQGITKAETPNP